MGIVNNPIEEESRHASINHVEEEDDDDDDYSGLNLATLKENS